MTSCGTFSNELRRERVERFGKFSVCEPVTLQRDGHARHIHGGLPVRDLFRVSSQLGQQQAREEIYANRAATLSRQPLISRASSGETVCCASSTIGKIHC